MRQWAIGLLPEGWVHGAHWLGSRPQLRLLRPDRKAVTIALASSMFGRDVTPAAGASALELLTATLQTHYRSQITPLTTLASWGRDLWLRTIPFDAEVPVLEDGLQRLLRATTTQGRWDRMPAPAGSGGRCADLTMYDLRFGYAALCRHVGGPLENYGPADGDETDFRGSGERRWRRGRYLVDVTVPDGWAHVGILPRRLESDHWPSECADCPAVGDSGGSWCWPNRPGVRWQGWADAAELVQAAEAGWTFTVLEEIRFADGDPLGTWIRRLRAVRDDLAAVHKAGNADAETVKLAAGAARGIVLHTLGAFLGAPRATTGVVESSWDAPEGAQVEPLPDGRLVWTLYSDEQAWPETVHPEWSATVYARCRASLLGRRGTGALSVPFAQVVAFRQDAVWLASDPQWADDGKVGTFRRDVHAGERPWPQRTAELLDEKEGNQ